MFVLPMWAELAVFLLSSIGNLIFLTMIMFYTEPEMDVYRGILFYNCMHDIAITVSSFVARPLFIIDAGNFYVIANHMVNNFSHGFQVVFYFCYMYVFQLMCAVVAYSYFYRYLVVCKETIISMRKFLLGGMLPYVGVGAMITMNLIWLTPNDIRNRLLIDEMVNHTLAIEVHAHREQIIFVGQTTDPSASRMFLVGLLYMALSYLIIFIFATKVVTSFRIRNRFTKWHSVNKQVARSLIVQAITPSVTSAPVFILMAICVLYQPSAAFTHASNTFINVMMTLMPVINPFAATSFIKSYRDTVMRFVRYVLSCGASVSPVEEEMRADQRSNEDLDEEEEDSRHV